MSTHGYEGGFLTPFKVKQFATTLDDYIYTSDDQLVEGESKRVAAINTGNREENREVIPRLCRQKGLNPYEAKELGRR